MRYLLLATALASAAPVVSLAAEEPAVIDGGDTASTVLGLIIEIRQHYPHVVSVSPMSAADTAGLQEGDQIIGVDGVSMYNKTLDEVMSALHAGVVGTRVQLTLIRGASQINLAVERPPIAS